MQRLNFNIYFVYRLLGLMLCGLGCYCVIAAFQQLEKNASPFPSPVKNGRFIQSGLYKQVRHPIYSGMIFMTLGYGVYCQSYWKLGIGLLLWLLLYFKSRYEEALLARRFVFYNAYRKGRNRFFPKL